MGIFSEDHKTSISLYVENLSNYEEIEWYQFQQLTEGIAMQPSGAKEAIEAIRKKLKHGTTEQKLRVLEILKLLMENSNQRFHRELVGNEKMIERFEIIIDSSFEEDIKVRKILLNLLATCATKFQKEQGMQILQRLYERGRSSFSSSSAGHDKKEPLPPPKQTSSEPMFDRFNNTKKVPPPPSKRNPPSFDQRHHDIAPNDLSQRSRHKQQQPTAIDIEKMKPKIIQEVALANQSANNLVNALRRINTSDQDWEHEIMQDKTIQQVFERCEEEQKKISKYARMVEDEEWIGTLLSANEELLKALDMYDIMMTGQVPALLVNHHTPLTLLSSPHHEGEEEKEKEEEKDDVYSRLSRLQITQGGDTHVPRDENGQILEDPFADPT